MHVWMQIKAAVVRVQHRALPKLGFELRATAMAARTRGDPRFVVMLRATPKHVSKRTGTAGRNGVHGAKVVCLQPRAVARYQFRSASRKQRC